MTRRHVFDAEQRPAVGSVVVAVLGEGVIVAHSLADLDRHLTTSPRLAYHPAPPQVRRAAKPIPEATSDSIEVQLVGFALR